MELVDKMTAVSKYPAYRESGVEWLGDVPQNWGMIPNKFIYELKKNLVGKNSDKYTLLSLTLNGIVKRDMDNPQGKFPAEFDTYQEVQDGDFVFCLFDVEETPRCVGLSAFNGMITGAYTVLSTTAEFERKYLYYFYLNLDNAKRLRPLYTGLRNTISKDRFFAFKTFIPPLQEQKSIAAFLDDKTSKIERAIAQKEQMIELLKERKQIIIQNAVTKGLDPNVKMKDSGVDWIGEIPEHWEVLKFKQVFTEKKKILNGNLPAGAISYGIVKYKSENSILESTKESYQEVLKGEFLINPLNLNYDLVSLRIALSEIDVVVSSGYIVLNEKKELNRNYMRWLLHRFDISQMKLLGSGVRQTISFNHLANELLVLPSKKEQQLIESYINSKLNQLDSSISLQLKQIDKLKEYKATLIDSAVTGKIKVC